MRVFPLRQDRTVEYPKRRAPYHVRMIDWDDGLRVAGSTLYLDSRRPRARSVVTHAHSDHISGGQSIPIPFDTDHLLDDGQARLRLHSAGHVLGSAMVHLTNDRGSLLYTGDFKLRQCITVPCAQPVPADVLIMETTYGRPMFRFPPRQQIVDQLLDMVGRALQDGRQPIVMGYSLGKAQEIVAILTSAGFPVTEHGAVANLSDVYVRHGVDLGPRRRYAAADFRGPHALDLQERGVLVAPPQVARSGFVDHFGDRKLTIMMSGWALLKGAQYRYGVDHVLPLSDHADFDELLELVDRVRPKQVYTLHGFPDFVDHLLARGIKAALAKPDPQLRLFE
jgi:putative mRNA 3-end processing factor